MMIMKSLLSKNFVSVVFSWQYLYYCLNSDGVEYLTTYLGIEGKILPETHKENKKS